jgi:hypothetical protein
MVALTCTPAPWSLCIVNRDGEILVHRHRPAGPEPFLKTSAPYRTDRVVCVECLLTWEWRADRCARDGMPVVLGHALSMKASPRGHAQHAKLDAQTIAVRLRGGMLPQADGDPEERRATRDLLRRRLHRTRQRAALLTHVPQTHWPYHRPARGQKSASKANRHGVAARFPDPAGHTSVDVARALMDCSDQ